jgi:F-type H+-transporting ATPase subunit epsilon
MAFQCSVVTPERAVLDVEARSVVFPAHDGLVGILTNRAPLLTQLGIGPLKVETGAETHLLMIDGGFAQMVDNKLTLLTEQATRASEIDRAEARRALEEAMARPAHTAEEYAARRDDIERARTLLKLAPVER